MLNSRTLHRALLAVLAAAVLTPFSTAASTLYVAPGGAGNGTAASPFGRIADALAVAAAGDTVLLKPGTYSERLKTVRGGTSSSRLVIRAEKDGTAILASAAGIVVRVSHPYVTVRGLVVDALYGFHEAVLVDSAATSLVLQYLEVKRSAKDCIEMRAPANVVVERSVIHHCLNATNGRTDAHGIVAGAVRNLIVRDTKIHTFSGTPSSSIRTDWLRVGTASRSTAASSGWSR